MNKKGESFIFLALIILIFCGLMIVFSVYDGMNANKECKFNDGELSIKSGFFSNSYSCIINNSKYEMVEILNDGFKIIDSPLHGKEKLK